jgi:8-oxo-dGTP pyrophosphatase MutT (NUDIX family)
MRVSEKKQIRSAGAVVFRRTGSGVKLLVLRAYNNWDFPKGRVEPGEEQLSAARREVKEETGLTDVEYPFGENYKETFPYGNNKIARYYLAETGEHAIELPVSTALGRPEHHEFRWVSFEEAEALLAPRLTVVLEWARNTLAGH